ncbi:MAG: YHS domain-containing protein [Candidatus Omnitrophica bacterium]|nr:YHS domain-containing protein [Candidatus Omnitrophota bacterium]
MAQEAPVAKDAAVVAAPVAEVANAVIAPENVKNIVDPVCKMKIEEGKAVTAEYKGKIYNFDTQACADKFLAEPEKYLAEMEAEKAAAAAPEAEVKK